jgi:hypothetical protein
MMQATRQESKAVAEAILPGAAVAFGRGGMATITEAITMECTRCGALHDHEGEAVTLAPPQAWHLLQALRAFLGADAYREAARAIREAIEGPIG